MTAMDNLCYSKIKGYPLSRMSRTIAMIKAIDIAVLNTFPDGNVDGLKPRSDNKSQLTSAAYKKHLIMFGIKYETIYTHTPVEDRHIESFFGRFKEDYIYTRKSTSYNKFSEYMEWTENDYNNQRPHSSPNYMMPNEFELAIKDEEFRNKWNEIQKWRYEHIEFL